MKILVTMPMGATRDSFITAEIYNKIEALGTVIWNTSEKQFTPNELKDKIKDVEVCISGWGCTRLDEYVLESADKLKLIAHTGGSVAPLINEYAYLKGIKVISGNLLYAESVAEGVIAYMLSSLRKIPFYANEVQEGRWPTEERFNEGILEQTIGLVSFGMIPKHLVNMLKPFKMQIKVYSNHLSEESAKKFNVERASLKEIFATCKIISIHTAQTPETYHMIGKELLSSIMDGALLINTARGSVIDEEALVLELQKNKFNAVLDVFEIEPLPLGSQLKGLKNVILMPHMGGPTIDRRKFVTLHLINDIENYFAGKSMVCEISKEYALNMTR